MVKAVLRELEKQLKRFCGKPPHIATAGESDAAGSADETPGK